MSLASCFILSKHTQCIMLCNKSWYQLSERIKEKCSPQPTESPRRTPRLLRPYCMHFKLFRMSTSPALSPYSAIHSTILAFFCYPYPRILIRVTTFTSLLLNQSLQEEQSYHQTLTVYSKSDKSSLEDGEKVTSIENSLTKQVS